MRQVTLTARMRQFAPWVLVLASAAVAVGAYLQAFNYPFVYDDTGYIVQNTKLAGLHLSELWRLFAEPYNTASEFLPLRELSYWFDMTLFGLNPSAFRLHNIFLYLLCLPLVYATTSWLWRYFRPADAASARWAAAAVTALFALHPSHAEAVVWIAGRKDVQAAVFSLLALLLAVYAKRAQGLSAPYAAAALFALLAAMLSKATAVAVAPVIVLLWVNFWRDIPAGDNLTAGRRYSLLLWPLASLLLAACVALIVASFTTQRMPFYFGVEAVTRALAVLGWLARLSVSPESRHFFYPVLDDPHLPAMVAVGVAVLIAAAVGGVMLVRKRSLESFALVVFFLLCMPYLQLIPYAPPSLVSDRFLALAAWPVMLLIVALAWRLKPVPRTALLLAIALPWGFQTAERTRDWRSFETVIDVDLHAYPDYYMPAVYKIISIQLQQGLRQEAIETANSITSPELRVIMNRLIETDQAVNADTVTTGKPEKAMDLLWQAGLDLKQLPVEARWNPQLYHIWGQRRGMLKHQWEYLTLQFPGDATVRYNAGLWMLDTHFAGAVDNLRAAVESQRLPEPVRGTAYKNYGLALLERGRVAEAESPLRAALVQSPPDFRAYCLLAVVYKQTGRIEAAAHAEADCHSHAPKEGRAQ